MSQSTNDIYPTMMRVSIRLKAPKLSGNAESLIKTLKAKHKEFEKVYKTGRTERDVIGEVQIDDSIYYGINTLRAKK